MQFRHSWVLVLLIVIPLLHRWWKRRNQPASVKFPLSIPPSARLGSPIEKLLLLRYLALALLVVALARPQIANRYVEKTVNGIDIVMVMDVSASMNIEDLAETSRLEIAKETMRDFIKGRQVDRIGFVVFSGEAVTLSPPTLDYALVLLNIESVKTGVLKDGTAIGDGLSVAINRLKNSNARSKVIILLTDGDSNIGQVDPATAGELAADFEIKVYSIAIGREGRVKLPIRHKIAGQTITSYQWFDNALNPELLERISSITNAKFYRVTDADALGRVFREIDNLEKTKIDVKERYEYDELFQKPLIWACLLLLIEPLLVGLWWRFLP